MAQLHSDRKSWTASSDKGEEAVKNKRQYILPTTTDWTCTISKGAINCAPVYQLLERNLAVETIIESMEMTCKFAPLGCKEIGKFKEESERWRHEESCSFKPMECPMPGCSQAGVEHGLPEHLLTKHNISRMVDFEDDSYNPHEEKYAGKFELKPSTSWVMLRMPSRDGEEYGWEHYLLRQDSTTSGETLRITALEDGFTSLEDYGKPSFRLQVRTSDKDGTYLYSLRCKSTSSKQRGGMLVIPKQPVGEPFKCKVTLLDVGDDDEEDFEDNEDD